MKTKTNNKDNKKELRWFITVFITTFLLSLLFSFISTTAISNLKIIPAFIILIVVVFLGVIFDIIGVAVTVADENDFHAMASKKVNGAKTSIKLIRNSSKVSNICADVIGDICGVLSGAISALICVKITSQFGIGFDIQFILSATVAALTVGGKAIGKEIASNNSTKIVHAVGIVLNKFSKN